jgi:uncharacterized protein with ParB-like and HNH nuclease domain
VARRYITHPAAFMNKGLRQEIYKKCTLHNKFLKQKTHLFGLLVKITSISVGRASFVKHIAFFFLSNLRNRKYSVHYLKVYFYYCLTTMKKYFSF